MGRRGPDLAEEVALVAHGLRRLLLSSYRPWLRWEDLEDCYSQATFELVAQARRGELCCSDRDHLRNTFELRFLSRVRDRRRALRGRSPSQAILDGALSLGAPGCREAELADPRADVERRILLRFDLRSLQRAAGTLTPDQRLVLACQVGLQMSAGEFCRRFGWSHERYRKVAQRARLRLRRVLAEPAGAIVVERPSRAREPAGAGEPAGAEAAGVPRTVAGVPRTVAGAGREGAGAGAGIEGTVAAGNASRAREQKLFGDLCPGFARASGERAGTHL